MVMPSSSTDFFSPPLFSPFSFCLCSPLLFFFLLSRSPHCLLFFSVFSPFLLPFSPLCTGFVVVLLLSLVHSGGFAVADEDDDVEGLFHQHCFLSSYCILCFFFFAVPLLLLSPLFLVSFVPSLRFCFFPCFLLTVTSPPPSFSNVLPLSVFFPLLHCPLPRHCLFFLLL